MATSRNRCSFCHATRETRSNLIAGAGDQRICDLCIAGARASAAATSAKIVRYEPKMNVPSVVPRVADACSLCGLGTDDTRIEGYPWQLVVTDAASVCTLCLETCRELIEDDPEEVKFSDLGFPPSSAIEGLLVCEPARMLVVHFCVQTDPSPRRRLYARRFDEASYWELVPHEPDRDISDPTPSPVEPFVYFNRSIWEGSGGNWEGLFRVNCETRAVERLLPRGDEQHGWISQIVGISADGARLFVVGAAYEARDDVERARVGYGLAELDLAGLRSRPLAELRALFV